MRSPSPEGNERLTSSTGLVLLSVETLTTLALRTYLNVHLFLGLLLLPPLALKLASTGWRFARYYTGSEAYVLAGPPRMLLRMLAPLLVASTLALFGTGVSMIVVAHVQFRRLGCADRRARSRVPHPRAARRDDGLEAKRGGRRRRRPKPARRSRRHLARRRRPGLGDASRPADRPAPRRPPPPPRGPRG